MAKLTIDDIEIEVPNGTVLIEACKSVGIDVPNFCYYPKLELIGACRMCLVEVSYDPRTQRPVPKPVASCTTIVSDGMKVNASSPVVVKARQSMLEFLLVNHSLTCPTCDAGGECELQDQVFRYRGGHSRMEDPKIHRGVTSLGPFVDKNMERCVQCQRCTRYCDEIMGVKALGMRNRGAATEIFSFLDQPLDCVLCGNCVEVCPVGALTSNVFDTKGRRWDRREARTVCSYCSNGCSMNLEVELGQVLRTQAFLESGINLTRFRGVNDEFLCQKGRFGYQFVNSPERLTSPLIRRGDKLEPCSWDEALDFVANGLKRIRDDHGPDAIGGIASQRCTNEEIYAFQKFMRTAIGTNNIDHRVTFKDLGPTLPPGRTSPDLRALRAIPSVLLVGSDCSDEDPLLDTEIRMAVRNKRAVLVLADSRRSLISNEAAHHLRPQPGTEAILALGLANALLGMREITPPDGLGAALKPYTAERVAQDTGIAADALMAAAKALCPATSPGEGPPCAILFGPWLLRCPGGQVAAQVLRSVARLMGWPDAIELIEENNTRGARDMGAVPDLLPGYRPVGDAKARAELVTLWGAQPPAKPGLNTRQMLEACATGQLKALYVVGSNPAVTFPDGTLVNQALDKVEMLIVQDLFLTSTAQKADVVLPAASFAEKDGTFTNVEGRVQLLHMAIEPLIGTRLDYVIVGQIARRMGLETEIEDPWQSIDEIGAASGIYAGINHDRLEPGGVRWTDAHEVNVPEPEISTAAIPTPKATGDYPFVLLTGNALFHNGTLSTWAEGTRLAGPIPFVLVSPEDAPGLGLADGDMARVESDAGRLELAVKVTDKVAPGSVFVPINFPEAPVNTLQRRDRALDWVKVTKV